MHGVAIRTPANSRHPGGLPLLRDPVGTPQETEQARRDHRDPDVRLEQRPGAVLRLRHAQGTAVALLGSLLMSRTALPSSSTTTG